VLLGFLCFIYFNWSMSRINLESCIGNYKPEPNFQGYWSGFVDRSAWYFGGIIIEAKIYRRVPH
jgi:hypothetical protein